jgi:hypothetical protein
MIAFKKISSSFFFMFICSRHFIVFVPIDSYHFVCFVCFVFVIHYVNAVLCIFVITYFCYLLLKDSKVVLIIRFISCLFFLSCSLFPLSSQNAKTICKQITHFNKPFIYFSIIGTEINDYEITLSLETFGILSFQSIE